MLIIDKVSKKFENGYWGLREVSLTLNEGEILCLAGPNGAGKTTLINTIFRTIKITEGRISYNGKDNNSLFFKKKVICVPDETLLLELLTGEEYVEFVRKIYGASEERCRKLISLFGMNNFIKNTINTYSHGMKKKIQYIVAFMNDAKVIVMDEPYRGLDVESVMILEKLIEKFTKKGGSILIASHDLHMAENLCDKMIILSKGQISDMNSVEELKKKYGTRDIEKVFLKSSMMEENYGHIKKIIDDLYDNSTDMETPNCKNTKYEI